VAEPKAFDNCPPSGGVVAQQLQGAEAGSKVSTEPKVSLNDSTVLGFGGLKGTHRAVGTGVAASSSGRTRDKGPDQSFDQILRASAKRSCAA